MVELPTSMFLTPNPRTPELLRQLYVKQVILVKPLTADAHVELTVVHPGYGDIHRDTSCYFVNFADPNARENSMVFRAVVAADGVTSFQRTPDNIYAPFPLRTNFALRVTVRDVRTDGRFPNWTPPQVRELKLQADYVEE